MSRLTTRNVESKVMSELAEAAKLQNTDSESTKTAPVKKYRVHQLPYYIHQTLCRQLEEVNERDPDFWKRFAEICGLNSTKIQEMEYKHKKGEIPSLIDEIIGIMGDRDKSVNQLFVNLARLKQHRSMDVIKKFVEPYYYKYCKTEEEASQSVQVPDISDLLKNTTIQDGIPVSFELPLVLDMQSSEATSTQETSETRSDTRTDPSLVAPSFVSSEIDKREFVHAVPEVNYDELAEATGNWDQNNVLGRGGFGTVFRGVWKNTQVAIKRIEPRDKNSSKADYKLELKQSMNELRFLNSCRHDNVLSLYGYSLSGQHPCLIYQLMLGGTLEQRLFSPNSLTWQQKYCIALGTARGLQYLHTFRDKPLIHGDIKPANILLDQCLTPRIGDFGLTRESQSQKPVEISRVYGTRPYLPAEFIETKCLSTKIDTYSFGCVLYEMATKQKVFVKSRIPTHLVELMRNYFSEKLSYTEIIDATHPFDQIGSYIFSILTKLGQECTAADPCDRPEMQLVCRRIESFFQKPQQQPQNA
ncbi:serine/threonine-protein kinase pelle [Culicoides brevitarsis]|uniref:serine/threonine-protein kinase pelle n=1 Tax=Culicoides brevitarsis TaxID=469753 RepID=UPI00307C3879